MDDTTHTAPVILENEHKEHPDASPISLLQANALHYASTSKAHNTLRAYQADWNHFKTWCENNARTPLPATAETIALYLSAQAEVLKTSTLQRRLVSLGEVHRNNRHVNPCEDPAVRAVWRGIRRSKGTSQEGKRPALTEDIREMVASLPETITGLRDRALILLGFAAALRRSELISIDVEDISFSRDGVVVTIRKSKTDQEGQGRKVGIPYGANRETCPVQSLEVWLSEAKLEQGAVFRGIDRYGRVHERRLSDRAVALIVKRALEAAGRDASEYSGHSLRAGFATQAAMAGVEERLIQGQTGHKSLTVLRRYIREGSLFRDNAAAKVGL